MNNKKSGVVILLVLAVVSSIYFIFFWNYATESTSEIVKPEQASSDIVAEAKVVPVRMVTLSFSSGGVVRDIYTSAGARVNAGDPLVKLREYDEAEAELNRAEADLRRARATLGDLKETAETDVAVAQSKIKKGISTLKTLDADLKRTEQLNRDGIVSPQTLDQSRDKYESVRAELQINQTEYETAMAHRKYATEQWNAMIENRLERDRVAYHAENIRVAVANILSAQAAVDKARLALAERQLRAPFSGIIGKLELKKGEYIAAGATVATLADLSEWQVETTDLTELGVVKTKIGASVDITFDALEGFHLPGRVVKIQPMGEDRHGDILYTVTVKPDRIEPRLQWNMTATVTIRAS